MDKENALPSASSAGLGVSASPMGKSPRSSSVVSFPSTAKPGDPDEDRDVDAAPPGGPPKRAPLIYPSSALGAKSNQKPFSRSAAKRDSVMALGSIGYLQHLYAKQGIASKTRPMTKGAMTLAIGRAGESMLAATPESLVESPTLSKAKLSRGDSDGQATAEDQHVLVTSPEHEALELPPSPKAPTSTRPPYPVVAKPVEADPEALWPVMVEHLDTTCQLWGLLNLIKTERLQLSSRRLSIEPGSRRPSSRSSTYSADGADGADEAPEASPIDLLELINATTKTVRSVRNYLLALPPASLSGKRLSKASAGALPKDRFKRQSSFSSLPRTASLSPLPLEKAYGSLSRRVSSSHDTSPGSQRTMPSAWQPPSATTASPASIADFDPGEEDPLTLVRKSALEVLSTLRELEEKYRLPPGHPEYDKTENEETEAMPEDAAGLGVSLGQPRNARTPSSPAVRSLATLSNPSTADLSFNDGPDKGGEGYLYRSDLKLADLGKERGIMSGYLTTVDRVLSVVQRPKQTKRTSKRLSTGFAVGAAETAAEPVEATTNPEITIQPGAADNGVGAAEAHEPKAPESAPAWARKGEYPGGEIGRIRAFLLAHLSPEEGFELLQLSTEVSESDNALDISRDQLLAALVDGSMLCHAYNAALRQSARPWGFIQPQEIHDLKAAEAEALEKQQMLAKKAEAEAEPFQVKDSKGRREASGATDEADDGKVCNRASVASPSNLMARPGWTFRRAENLRVWAAALRLRYHIQTTSMSSLEPLSKPLLPGLGPPAKLGLHPRRVFSDAAAAASTTSITTTSSSSSTASPAEAREEKQAKKSSGVHAETIEFEAKKVARKEEGWEKMLCNLIVRWLEAVAQEETGEDGY
ncbi:hypothetical protein ACQY0O_006348 [Thecaphora frezii]